MEPELESDNYKFFKNVLGSPKFIVAPMVDQSELPFRMQTRKYGAQLVYTQMFNANSYVNSPEYREYNMRTCPQDRPLIVQFAGHDPQVLLQAAKMVQDQCEAIDINLGCPQGIAKRGRYGAFLMEELELLDEIVSTLVNGLKVPVTCKTRIYDDFERSIKLCETLVNAGASMLVIHGRRRDQKGQSTGPANWEMLRKIKQHFGKRIPIVANGGISCYEDINRCLLHTGCDGVMTSEAILENPALFANIKLSPLDLAEEYLQLCRIYPVWHIKSIRSHIMKFLHRYSCRHLEVRDKIATAHSLKEFEDACNVSSKFCKYYVYLMKIVISYAGILSVIKTMIIKAHGIRDIHV